MTVLFAAAQEIILFQGPLCLLYRYQREGVRFGIRKTGRILLADEPGLGKTVQVRYVSPALKSLFKRQYEDCWLGFLQ